MLREDFATLCVRFTFLCGIPRNRGLIFMEKWMDLPYAGLAHKRGPMAWNLKIIACEYARVRDDTGSFFACGAEA